MNSKRRPQWDDSLADRSQYRLTYSEQLQRKAAYVSKNKESAREELQKRQELLKQGRIPEEIKKTLRTPSVKHTAHSKSQKNTIQKEVPTVPQATQETHFAPLKKTQKASIEDHLDTLSKLDQAMKDLEAVMLKAASSESKEPLEVSKSNEDSISEGSLFGISDEDEFYQSRQSFKSNDKKAQGSDAFIIDYNEPKPKNEGFGKIFGVESKANINFAKIGAEPAGDLEQTSKFCYNDDPIPYENVWADESQNDLFNLVEQTRKDLSAMNINTNDDLEIAPSEFLPFKYDSDVVPQKFNLVPLGRPAIPRAGTSSLSIFDHMKSVQIDCRKFIIH